MILTVYRLLEKAEVQLRTQESMSKVLKGKVCYTNPSPPQYPHGEYWDHSATFTWRLQAVKGIRESACTRSQLLLDVI